MQNATPVPDAVSPAAEAAIMAETRRTVRLGLLLALPAFGTCLGLLYQILSGVGRDSLDLLLVVGGLWSSLLVIACWIASLPVWEGPFRSALNERRKRSIHLLLFLSVFGVFLGSMLLMPPPEVMAAFLKSVIVLVASFLFVLYGIDTVQRMRIRQLGAS